MREIQIGGKTYEVHSLQGRVVDRDKHFETVLSGGSLINHADGHAAPMKSQTVVHDQIFVLDSSGREHVVKLVDWDVDCRAGHVLTLTWLIKKGRDSGPYVVIENESTGDVKVHEGELAKLFSPNAILIGACACLTLTISFAFGRSQIASTAAWYGFWIVLIGGFVYRY